MTTNYAAFTARISKATTHADFDKLEVSLVRLYDNGVFTPNELARLDHQIVRARLDLQIELEDMLEHGHR